MFVEVWALLRRFRVAPCVCSRTDVKGSSFVPILSLVVSPRSGATVKLVSCV